VQKISPLVNRGYPQYSIRGFGMIDPLVILAIFLITGALLGCGLALAACMLSSRISRHEEDERRIHLGGRP